MPAKPWTAFGKAFSATVAECPEAVAAYGSCLQRNMDESGVARGVCSKEFGALKACFQRCARRRLKR